MKRKWPLYVAIVVAGLAADLLTKNWAFQAYPPTLPRTVGKIVVDGFFTITTAYNDRFAFSLGPKDTTLVVILHVAAFSAIGYLVYNLRRAPMHVHVALSFILAGALGNLYDRMTQENGVRDFIDWYVGDYHWPTFNVADSMVSVGATLIVITLLFTKTEKREKKAKASNGS